jgi:tRNA(fMet)-specific endonuclease VapC
LAALLDTDVVIHLRDGDAWTENEFRQLSPPLFISAITRIELENGIWREPEWASLRRRALEQLLVVVTTLPFSHDEIAAYQRILEMAGFSKRKIADRMTAATALVHDLPLVTFNGRDFRDIQSLSLIDWSRPDD